MLMGGELQEHVFEEAPRSARGSTLKKELEHCQRRLLTTTEPEHNSRATHG
jgi:hypothetical protein